jgi:molecular chaperone GrpE
MNADTKTTASGADQSPLGEPVQDQQPMESLDKGPQHEADGQQPGSANGPQAGSAAGQQPGGSTAQQPDAAQGKVPADEHPVPAEGGVEGEDFSLVHELEQQLQESRDKYLRLLAEFDNYKRRSAKERIEMRKTAAEDLITDLLDVLDDFQRAKSALDGRPEAAKEAEGFLLIAGKFKHILDQRELKAMVSLGTPFDPERHEAITEIPAPDETGRGMVLDVVEEGYLLGEKIIRYAKVVVGK